MSLELRERDFARIVVYEGSIVEYRILCVGGVFIAQSGDSRCSEVRYCV